MVDVSTTPSLSSPSELTSPGAVTPKVIRSHSEPILPHTTSGDDHPHHDASILPTPVGASLGFIPSPPSLGPTPTAASIIGATPTVGGHTVTAKASKCIITSFLPFKETRTNGCIGCMTDR
jgi:hypothetical protein